MALPPGHLRLLPPPPPLLLRLPPPTPLRLPPWRRRAFLHQRPSRPVVMRPKMGFHNQTDISNRQASRGPSTALLRMPSADSQRAGSAVWTTWDARTTSITTHGRQHGRDRRPTITKARSGRSAKRTCRWSDEHIKTGRCRRIAREPVPPTCRTAKRPRRRTVQAAVLPPRRRTRFP